MAQYQQGTVTVSAGSAHVHGVGTAWSTAVKPGDMLLIGDHGPAAFIAAVPSDTELVLEQPWVGADALDAAYAIHRDFDPTSGAPLVAVGDIAVHLLVNRAIARLSLQTLTASVSAVPIGSILKFAGPLPPAGYLPCDGRAVSRTGYPRLFQAIHETFGPGDGTTTFNLPEHRMRYQPVESGGYTTHTETVTDEGGNTTTVTINLAVFCHGIRAT
ncbi:MAG: Bordetella phage vB BbrM [Pseudomonadota bacterium]|jgi:hypothetical protein